MTNSMLFLYAAFLLSSCTRSLAVVPPRNVVPAKCTGPCRIGANASNSLMPHVMPHKVAEWAALVAAGEIPYNPEQADGSTVARASARGPTSPCVSNTASGYACDQIDLVSLISLSDLGGTQGNDIWGWTDIASSSEYVLACHNNGVTIVQIDNPNNPLIMGRLAGPTCQWRDAKVYADHMYVVSECGGMQVFDLRRLRSITGIAPGGAINSLTADTTLTSFGNAHNIIINEETAFAYVVGSRSGTIQCGSGLSMFDISTPLSPVFVGCFASDGYTHDAQVVVYRGPDLAYQGREIAFCYNEDTITIVDVSVKSAPVQVSRTAYANSGYTHQGWLTDDQAFLLMNDELDELNTLPNFPNARARTRMWNVTDLTAPSIVTMFDSPDPTIDHNLYVDGRYAYASNYCAGLRVYEITTAPPALTEVAYFDTHPGCTSTTFTGAWSTYPFFRLLGNSAGGSKILATQTIDRGLFLLDYRLPSCSPACDAAAGLICDNGLCRCNAALGFTPGLTAGTCVCGESAPFIVPSASQCRCAAGLSGPSMGPCSCDASSELVAVFYDDASTLEVDFALTACTLASDPTCAQSGSINSVFGEPIPASLIAPIPLVVAPSCTSTTTTVFGQSVAFANRVHVFGPADELVDPTLGHGLLFGNGAVAVHIERAPGNTCGLSAVLPCYAMHVYDSTKKRASTTFIGSLAPPAALVPTE